MEQLKLKDFLNYRFLSSVQYAPGGKRAAFVVAVCNEEENCYESRLWMYDGGLRQLTDLGKEGQYVWEDETHILFPAVRSATEQKRQKAGEQFTSYYRLDVTGGEALPAFTLPFQAQQIRPLGDGKWLVSGRIDANCPDYPEMTPEARAEAEKQLATHAAELQALGQTASGLTEQREKLTASLSDAQMQRLTCEKDVGLHEAALETLKGRSGEAEARRRELNAAMAAAQATIERNELQAAEIERTRGENKQKISAAETAIRTANEQRLQKEAEITRLGQENRALTDERERMSGEMARLAERRAAAENELNTTAAKLWDEYQLTENEAQAHCVEFANVTDLRRQVAEIRAKIRALGNVNVGAIDEYKEVKERYDFLKAQVGDVERSKAELTRMIGELCREMEAMFTKSFKEINRNFGHIFRELFGGGSARLYLSDETDVLGSGIEIEVNPPGKVIRNLSALSGGEQALVAISIYFAILEVNPSPFCILDEIEAALDDVNVTRYAQYLRRMTGKTQFIVITHRRGTMEAADVLYGVTMQEDGVSKLLRLDLENVSAELVS